MAVHRPVRLRLPRTSARRCGASREGAAMIRTKGEAGTGDIVNAVTPHARGLRRDPAARVVARGRALRRGEEAPGAVRARALGRGARPPAGRDLHRRRDRDPGRRGALHAARRRRRLRRLRDLQVRRPGQRAKAIVEATTHFADAEVLARVSSGLGEPMVGISAADSRPSSCSSTRGWWLPSRGRARAPPVPAYAGVLPIPLGTIRGASTP